MKPNKVAKLIRTSYGKLSFLDHTAHKAIRKLYSLEGTIKLLESIPSTPLSKYKKKIVDCILVVMEENAERDYDDN